MELNRWNTPAASHRPPTKEVELAHTSDHVSAESPAATDPTRGLTAAEVADRTKRGEVNTQGSGTGRSVAQILRANIFTRVNAILGVLCAIAAANQNPP